MRNINFISVIAASLFVTGCSDTVAREYAKQVSATLRKYQESVDEQIRAQLTGYGKIAKILDHAAEQDVLGQLETERLESVTKLKDGLLLETPSKRLELNESRLRDTLMRYARHDFEVNRTSVSQELDGYKRFMAGLQDLDQESANLRILAKLLSDLSEKKGAIDRVKEATQFGQAVQDNFTKLQCAALTAEEKDLAAVLAGFDAKLSAPGKEDDPKALQKAKDDTNSRLLAIATAKSDKKCDKGATNGKNN